MSRCGLERLRVGMGCSEAHDDRERTFHSEVVRTPNA